MSESELIRKLKAFCAAHGLASTGVLLITVQRNWTTSFSSLVVDFDNERLLDSYHREIEEKAHKGQLRVGPVEVAFAAGLPPPMTSAQGGADQSTQYRKPFCCDTLQPYKHRPTSDDHIFASLLQGHGHHPGIIYEVRCQRDNGPLLSTDYFRLTNQASVEQVYGHYEQKRTAYKCYKCALHSLFYAVNLFSEGGTQGANRHHIRLYPFTKRVDTLLDEFFRQCGIN